MLAMYQRLRTGKEPIEPDAKLGMAANFLYMVNGEKPTETQSKAFDLYLVLLAEHSMNASTFTARSTVSSTSDLYSAVNAALGSLKGVAHGGANMMAMEMLLDIGDPNKIEEYINESLRIKRRIMGLGHRIYKTRDPRVDHLMHWSEQVAREVGDDKWYQLAHNMEELTAHHPYFS
jgi:citrate synthase